MDETLIKPIIHAYFCTMIHGVTHITVDNDDFLTDMSESQCHQRRMLNTASIRTEVCVNLI